MGDNCFQIMSVLLQWNVLAGWTIFETGIVGTVEDELTTVRKEIQKYYATIAIRNLITGVSFGPNQLALDIKRIMDGI